MEMEKMEKSPFYYEYSFLILQMKAQIKQNGMADTKLLQKKYKSEKD